METNSAIFFHSTYFKLPAGSTEATRKSYMAACTQYLSTTPGMISFWVGERALDMTRDVNDQDFDVTMTQAFRNKSYFDLYSRQDTSHDQFVIEVNRWTPGTTRRVNDATLSHLSYVENCSLPCTEACATGTAPRLMHSIYWQLINRTAGNQAKLIEICMQHLSQHPGICTFTLGVLADLKRDVSVNNYDVTMTIIWKSKAYYDQYLASPSHEDFFPPTKDLVKSTFVFDSYLQPDVSAPSPAA